MLDEFVEWPAEAAQRYRERGYWEGITLGERLRKQAEKTPGRVAIVHENRQLTFQEMNHLVDRLAAGLHGYGLSRGDRVIVQLPNIAAFFSVCFALLRIGVIPVLTLPAHRENELAHLANLSGATAYFIADSHLGYDYRALARAVAARAPTLRHVFVAGQAQEFVALDEIDAEPYALDGPQPGDVALLLLSGGTTGLPKCYRISHYNACSFFAMFHAFHMRPEDVVMTVFPAYGRVGFAWIACGVMWGCRNVLTNFDAAQTLDLIARERVTIINLVPTMGAMLLDRPELDTANVASLRAVVFAGSLLPAPIRDGVMSRLCPNLYEYYGMQETSTLVVSTPEDRVLRPDSVGLPILFAHVRVVDAEGHDVPPGETGAVIGRSPGTVTGYHNNPEKTAETFRDGWLHTGDLGRLDADGYLYINGRIKDVIVTGGQNVHAGEIEETILGLPQVSDCAVIGLSDPLWGEAVTAVVVPKDRQEVDPDTVIAWCRRSLAGFKTPKRVIIQTEPLPRTLTGKVQKFLLTKRYNPTLGTD